MIPEPCQSFKQKGEPLLAELEKVRKTTVFPMLFSMNREISKPDVDEIYDTLSAIGANLNLDVILFSLGGDPDQAYLIGTLLQEYGDEKLTIIIPRLAKSAATLLACAADEIVLLPPAELGPVELMIESPETKRYVPVRSIVESIEMLARMDLGEMRLRIVQDALAKFPLTELGDFGRLTEHMRDLTEKLLSRRMFKKEKEKAKEVAKKLCEEFKSHSAPITVLDARDMGIKLGEISEEVKNLLWQFHKLWITTVVEYENTFELEEAETFNFPVGKGLVFCAQRRQSNRVAKTTK